MVRPTELERTIFHESGHALVAWYCWYVADVKEINITTSGGKTYETMAIGPTAARWEAVAICLAGMAAEVAEFGSARSGPAAGDLSTAKILAEGLAAKGISSPPWGDDNGSVLDFATMFRTPLTPAALTVFRFGYRRACRLIADNQPPFRRLIAALTAKPRLSQDEIKALFGPRLWGIRA